MNIYTLHIRCLFSSVKMYERIPESISYYLNEWFDGKVIFEVDTYFTTKTIGSESFDVNQENAVFANEIKEVKNIINKYDSVLTVSNLNHLDDKYIILVHSGTATAKFAWINAVNFMCDIEERIYFGTLTEDSILQVVKVFIYRLFLLHEAQLNGEPVGIRPEFWVNRNK